MSLYLIVPATAFLLYLFNKQTLQNIYTPELTKDDTISGLNRKPERGSTCKCEHGFTFKPETDKIGSNNFLSCSCKKCDNSYNCGAASKESCILHKRLMALTNPRLPYFNDSHLKMVNSGRKCKSLVGVVQNPICSNCHFKPSVFTNF